MTAPLIVDGNNVIGSRPDGWWRNRAAATRRLVEQLAAWAAKADQAVTVVFDGPRPKTFDAPPSVEVIFAERSRRDAADDVIAALVADDPRPQRIDVVTSDAGLAARVRAHGASVIGSRAFRDELDEPGSTPAER
jgi:predicted RNA-binding protein with PIN domain